MKQADLDDARLNLDERLEEFCLRKLDALAALEPGWDSDGAPSIDRDILNAARQFVRSLPDRIAPRPMVVPLSSGHVQLEWHSGRRVLELEFESPSTVHYLKWDPEHGVEEEALIDVSETAQLIALIAWFTQGGRDG